MKTKNIFYSSLLATILITGSCHVERGYIILKGQNDDIIANAAAKKLIKEKERPTIVLRAQDVISDVTHYSSNSKFLVNQKGNALYGNGVTSKSVGSAHDNSTEVREIGKKVNSSIYAAIEKELMAWNFNVKDRDMFNTMFERASSTNYTEISELTDVDLILEVVNIERNVPIRSNTIYDENGYKVPLKNEFTRVGAIIEFKLIMVKTNEVVGSFLFNWIPCQSKSNNCNCSVGYKSKEIKYSNYCRYEQKQASDKDNPTPYEVVPNNILDDIAKAGVRKMIMELRSDY